MPYSVFTYGTLEIAEVMYAVTAKQFRSQPAVLQDFTRYKLKSEAYPGIIPQPGGVVNGTVYFGLDDIDIHKLDRYEDTCYKRQRVIVRTPAAQEIEALAYVITEGNRELLSEQDWDKQTFIDEELPRFLRSISMRM